MQNMSRFTRQISIICQISKRFNSSTSTAVSPEGRVFSELGVHESIIESLSRHGITRFYPIQAATFEHIKSGKDIIAKAHTGTGKTLAFLVPVIQKVVFEHSVGQREKYPRALVLAPTRELANQISGEITKVSNRARHACIYGGVSYGPQARALKSGVDLVVGTPGRILDLMEQGDLNLSKVQTLVLDECDHMLDIGFRDDIEKIFAGAKATNSDTFQTLLFSATLSPWIKNVAQKKFMSPKTITIDLVGSEGKKANENITYVAIPTKSSNMIPVLIDSLRVYAPNSRALVFTETKVHADEVANSLSTYNNAAALHSGLTQGHRERIIKDFRSGRIRCLVATDIAARGIDIPNVDCVFQLTFPRSSDQFLHKSGRTGRANCTGTSFTFYDPFVDESKLEDLEKRCGVKFLRKPPPTKKDTVDKAFSDLIKRLETVDPDVIHNFSAQSKAILERFSAENAVSALLAQTTTASMMCDRSILTGEPGRSTFHMTFKAPLNALEVKKKILAQMSSLDVTLHEVKGKFREAMVDIPVKNEESFRQLLQKHFDSQVSMDKPTEIMPLVNHRRFDDDRRGFGGYSRHRDGRNDFRHGGGNGERHRRRNPKEYGRNNAGSDGTRTTRKYDTLLEKRRL